MCAISEHVLVASFGLRITCNKLHITEQTVACNGMCTVCTADTAIVTSLHAPSNPSPPVADSIDFESLQAYDVADLLKQYFRELPECLLTTKLSETFISIFTRTSPFSLSALPLPPPPPSLSISASFSTCAQYCVFIIPKCYGYHLWYYYWFE